MGLGNNSWAAYQFDALVLYLGSKVENALEANKVAPKGIKHHKPKPAEFVIAQALNLKDFKLTKRITGNSGVRAGDVPGHSLEEGANPWDDLVSVAIDRENKHRLH